MSIKTNLLIALFLVVSVMLATAGYLGWSSTRITRQLDSLATSVAYLESIASVRASITRQMKQVVDCLISDSASSRAEFDKAAKATQEYFSQMESSSRDMAGNEIIRVNRDPRLVEQLKESYQEWNGLAIRVMELCGQKEQEKAKETLSETSFLVVESSLLNAIDNALEGERNRVQTESNLL